MDRFGCHSIAERIKNRKHIITERKTVRMETRTFRVGPSRSGANHEALGVIVEHPHEQNSRACYEYFEEEDDPMMIAVPEHSLSSHNSIRDPNLGFEALDGRDDEPFPMVLRSYNRKDHHFHAKPYPQQHQPTKQHPKAAKGGRTSTETEKRIAQLRNAGLLIASKAERSLPKPSPSPRKADQGFRAQHHHEVEQQREPPPPPPVTNFEDPKWHDLASNSNKYSLQALLERDEKHRQKGKEPPPRQLSPWVERVDPDPILKVKQSNRVGTSVPLSPRAPQTSNAVDLAEEQRTVDPIIVARPDYRGLRVSLDEYPDPETFGWTFVGSCGERRVEFFELDLGREKGLVDLEFHYVTGTVRATLEHPLWGKSPLTFARGGSRESPRGYSPKIYQKVLVDPLGCSSITDLSEFTQPIRCGKSQQQRSQLPPS